MRCLRRRLRAFKVLRVCGSGSEVGVWDMGVEGLGAGWRTVRRREAGLSLVSVKVKRKCAANDIQFFEWIQVTMRIDVNGRVSYRSY